jgi:hypothetical protein
MLDLFLGGLCNMKKFLLTILVLTMLFSFFTVPALAANFESSADDLKSLGLFFGTDKGYELDEVTEKVFYAAPM